jgi:VanZ family protein
MDDNTNSSCRSGEIPLSSGVPKLKSLLYYWLPPAVWMVVIFSASGDTNSLHRSSTLFVPLLHWLFPAMSIETIEVIHYGFRKCGHLAEYALLALLLWRAIHQPQRKSPKPWRWDEAGLVLALIMLYAASDEIHQTFVPRRAGLVSDVFIDTAGGAAGLFALWLARKIFKRA